MSHLNSQRTSLLAVLCLSLVACGAPPVLAQDADRTNSPDAAAPDEEAARRQILHSDQWQDMQFDFDQWLSVQSIYTPEEVQDIIARMERGVSRMTSGQLQRFLVDMQDRLDVLNSPNALSAQIYLTEKLQVASAAYAKRIRESLPDVLTTSAAQMEKQLLVHAQRRSAAQQRTSAFKDARQQSVASNQAQRQAQVAEQQRRVARNRGAAERNAVGDISPSREYFPDVGRRQNVPFFGGFGGMGIGPLIF